MKYLSVAIVVACLAVASASAQPTVVTFTASPSHAWVTSYAIGYFPSGATLPTATANLGKPTPDTANLVTAAIDVTALPAAVYVGRVKALSPGTDSGWSAPSNTFEPRQTGVTMTTAQKVQLTVVPTPAGTIPVGTLMVWSVEGQTSTNILGTFEEVTGGVPSVWYLPVKAGTHVVRVSFTLDGSTFNASTTITVANVLPATVAITVGAPVAK